MPARASAEARAPWALPTIQKSSMTCQTEWVGDAKPTNNPAARPAIELRGRIGGSAIRVCVSHARSAARAWAGPSAAVARSTTSPSAARTSRMASGKVMSHRRSWEVDMLPAGTS